MNLRTVRELHIVFDQFQRKIAEIVGIHALLWNYVYWARVIKAMSRFLSQELVHTTMPS